MQWGSGIEVSNYDDAGRVATDNAARSETYINIDARMSNLGKEADYFLGVRPGTDGALVMAWLKIAIENDLYQDNFVRRWTDCSFLVCEDMEPSGWEETFDSVGLVGIVKAKRKVNTVLLKESDLREGGDPKKFIVWDEANNRFTFLDAGTACWEGETFKPKFHDWEYVKAANLQDKYDWEPAQGKMVSNSRKGISDMFLPDQSPMPTVEGCATPTKPALWTEGVEVTLKDGRTVTCRTVWEHLYDNCKEFTPQKAEEITGVKAQLIEEACRKYCQLNEDGYGDGTINYAVTHEHTGNAMKMIHCFDAFDAIMGRTDTPGGHRGSTRAASVYENQHTLLVGQFLRVGTKNRVTDKEQAARKIGTGRFPLYANADATSVYRTMITGDPHPIKGGLTQAGGMLNQTNLHLTWDGVKNLDFYTNWNLWHDPISDLADLLLPEAHWLEVECGRCAQGSGGYYGAHIKCVEMPGDVKWGIDIVGEWYKKNGLEFWKDRAEGEDPWEMGDYPRTKAIASTGMDWQQYRTKFIQDGWFDARTCNPEGFGTCRRYETGWMVTPFQGRPGFRTNTSRYEIWSTGFENAMRNQVEQLTGQLFGTKYALPYFVENKSSPYSDQFRQTQANNPDNPNHDLYADYTPENYPYILSTGRRIPVYFHSEHRQLPWCREVWPVPRLEVNPKDAADLGLNQGDWAWIETPFSKIRQCVDINASVGEGRMNAEHSWWFPELKRVGKGFDLCGCNCLVDAYAQCEAEGAPQLRGYLAKVYKATPENSPFGNPVPCDDDGTPIITDASRSALEGMGATDHGRKASAMTQFGIVTDLNRCVGCMACNAACKTVNAVPIGNFWNKVLRVGPNPKYEGAKFPDVEWYYLPVQCQHCANPACVNVCPTGASHKVADGTVQVAKEKCIGCQFCAMACPYNVRYLNEEERVVEKCTLCEQQTAQGELPQCVSQCAGLASGLATWIRRIGRISVAVEISYSGTPCDPIPIPTCTNFPMWGTIPVSCISCAIRLGRAKSRGTSFL